MSEKWNTLASELIDLTYSKKIDWEEASYTEGVFQTIIGKHIIELGQNFNIEQGPDIYFKIKTTTTT